MDKIFSLVSEYPPAGDQPRAISELIEGLNRGEHSQMLLGITGSGKTFTMANIIEHTSRPTLIMAHNKTLAAQIYSEMKQLFPNNAVEYFVSYYDYYQPEAYMPRTDTYIEKDAVINERIDLLRHSATRSLLERRDVIVVASVSAIYGLGSPDLYYQMTVTLEKGKHYPRNFLTQEFVKLQYERNDLGCERGTFRINGDIIDIFPSHYSDKGWRLSFFDTELEYINEFDPVTGAVLSSLDKAVIYANSHFVTPKEVIHKAIDDISNELVERVNFFRSHDKLIEAQRIKQRTEHDIEMLLETGSCKGIENYSRFLSGHAPGEPPPTLFQYLPQDALLFVDESHVSVPQIRGMYNGDRARKSVLVEHGFRLLSALDNRPLTFDEWQKFRPQTIFVSATPGPFELSATNGVVVEQIIRPTGLLDPECTVLPAKTQVDDLLKQLQCTISRGFRVLVTTLTKKMAENLTEYLQELNYKVSYLHSNVQTLERIEIINDLKQGKIDIIIGINLLREGLDIPECGLVAILDADKEGFLRSDVALIQTIGRAARNSEGRVVLYADNITKSMERALSETNRRRKIQQEYNEKWNIRPKTVASKSHALSILEKIQTKQAMESVSVGCNDLGKLKAHITKLKKEMLEAASNLDFEKAAQIRDRMRVIETSVMELSE